MIKSPQAEDGHTDIANEIMEALARIRIPGEARQVLDFIIRKTYGWHKKNDNIPLSQFVLGTGLKKKYICRAIKKLIDMNLIILNKENKWITNYMFNKNYDIWKPVPKKENVPNKENTIPNKENKYSQKRDTQKKITKETLSKEKERVLLNNYFLQIEKDFSQDELIYKNEFLEYWKEKSPGGKKERWQFEKVFDIKRRFKTWLKNKEKDNFKKQKKSEPKSQYKPL